jgi:hypothetical protein
VTDRIHELREDAIYDAFETSEIGDTITICRGSNCESDEICPMCARVTVVAGMTVQDVIEAARAYRA